MSPQISSQGPLWDLPHLHVVDFQVGFIIISDRSVGIISKERLWNVNRFPPLMSGSKKYAACPSLEKNVHDTCSHDSNASRNLNSKLARESMTTQWTKIRQDCINYFLSTCYLSLISESIFFTSEKQFEINNKEAIPFIVYLFQENLAKPAAEGAQVQPPTPTSPKPTSKLWDN